MSRTFNDFSNVSEFFRDFAVPCMVLGIPFFGIFDRPDDTFPMGGVNVQNTNYTLLITAVDLENLRLCSDQAIFVQDVVYNIRDVIALDDGAVFQLNLTKQ